MNNLIRRILIGTALLLLAGCVAFIAKRKTSSELKRPDVTFHDQEAPAASSVSQNDSSSHHHSSESPQERGTVSKASPIRQLPPTATPAAASEATQPLYTTSQHPYKLPSLSKDLVVHSAYLDPRPRHTHSNVTVLFVSVNRTILDSGWILGCGAGNTSASSYEVYSIFENTLMEAAWGRKPVPYQNQLMFCYGLSAKNGSSVYVEYKNSKDSKVKLVAYSRQPLFHPAPRMRPSGGDDFTVVVCCKAHNKDAPWFRQFIQYQKTLGVDHIDFSILDTFIQDGGYDEVLKDTVVHNALREGFISFRVWPETYVKPWEVYLHSENLRKLACMYRHLGTYDYVMPLDTDDFFNPMRSNVKLKDVIRNHCRDKTTGSCRFDWIRFYPDCGIDAVGSDGNITVHLKVKTQTPENNFKSIHSTKAILDASFHDARCRRCLLPGYRMKTIPRSEAYVAHIRLGLSEEWKKKICH